MVNELLIALGLLVPDLTAAVAVNASYALHTAKVEDVRKCCGLCKNGTITHGDGHKTPCACPDDCECKALRHPPAILKQECRDCVRPK
jgi:hypothetical protein